MGECQTEHRMSNKPIATIATMGIGFADDASSSEGEGIRGLWEQVQVFRTLEGRRNRASPDLFDQVSLTQWLIDTVFQFALVQPLRCFPFY
jgi:hypothetical protein